MRGIKEFEKNGERRSRAGAGMVDLNMCKSRGQTVGGEPVLVKLT